MKVKPIRNVSELEKNVIKLAQQYKGSVNDANNYKYF
jgi:hypothetical protein